MDRRRATRRFNLFNAIYAALAISTAFLVIIGIVSDDNRQLTDISDLFLQLAAITIAVAVLVGIWNLLVVHFGRLVRMRNGWWYSLVTLLTGVLVTAVYVMDKLDMWSGDLDGANLSPRVFETLQISIESALAGLIVFFLTYAAYRLLNKRFAWASMLFLVTVFVVLLGWLPLDGINGLADVRDWIMTVPVLAGTRGLLIGIGLGTVVVGIRTLTGTDRAYREP